MTRKFIAVVLFLLMIIPCGTVAAAQASGAGENSTTQLTAHFFWDHNCEECLKTLPFMTDYAERHPEVRVEFWDISSNRSYRQMFEEYKSSFNTPYTGVPSVFIDEVQLEGSDNIEKYIDTVTEALLSNTTVPEISVTPVPTEKPAVINQTPAMNPLLLLVAALGEGANPCGLLVLALLLVSLMASGSRRTVFLVGTSFVVSFFVVRLLSGFALFSVIQMPGVSRAFAIVAGIIALVFGIIQIKDGLAGRKGVLSIPDSKKGLFAGYIAKASVPAGIVLGVLTGIYGMACTAGIYIAILGMLGNSVTAGTGLFYLVVYNLIVVVPLIAIVLLVLFGLSPEKLSGWREEQKGLLRIIVGVIMVIMGLYLLATRLL